MNTSDVAKAFLASRLVPLALPFVIVYCVLAVCLVSWMAPEEIDRAPD